MASLRQRLFALRLFINQGPKGLALTLGVLLTGWGLWILLWGWSSASGRLYHLFELWMPPEIFGVVATIGGVVEVVASTNGLMYRPVGHLVLVFQAMAWGTVAFSSAVLQFGATSTPIYAGLAALSVVCYWQWLRARRRLLRMSGSFPPTPEAPPQAPQPPAAT